MTHARAIADRLPPLYTDGALVQALLAAGPGLALEILDEDLLEVQRAHFFDAALELDEAAGLAALLDIAPEPWQKLGAFRAWVHSLRDAMLTHGAVGPRALQSFVERYTDRFGRACGVPLLVIDVPADPKDWLADPDHPDVTAVERTSRAWFVEYPKAARAQRTPRPGGVEPLDRMQLINRGLDPTTAGLLLVGVPGGPEHVPVVVNVTTGRAVAFLGSVPPGERLRIVATGRDPGAGVRAELEGRDVTHLLRTVHDVVPGVPWDSSAVDDVPTALDLDRGANTFWYLPVAHYGAPGLDRVLLALASLDLRQGRYDEAAFDRALFAQDAAAMLTVAWAETQPATVAVALPGGALLARRGRGAEAVAARGELEQALTLGLDRLAAAGVRTTVEVAPFRELQPGDDQLTGRLPRIVREDGPSGADRMPDAGGVFEVTPYDDSTYR